MSTTAIAPNEHGRIRSNTTWIGKQTLIRLTLIACLIAAAIYSIKAVKYRFIAKRFGVVTPGEVFRSGQISKWMLEPTIKQNNIKVVIGMLGPVPQTKYHDFEVERLPELNVEFIRHGLDKNGVGLMGDGTGPIQCYIDALCTIDKLQREGKPCLVHCSAGSARTGVTMAYYQLLLKKQPVKKAYEEFVKYGGDIYRKEGTLPYLNENMQHVAEQLVKRGVLDKVPEKLPLLPVKESWF